MAEKKKILHVDDDSGFHYFVKRALESIEGWEVIFAGDGSEGLIVAKREKPDLILLDRLMPGMHGQEMHKMLAASSDLKNIPVIFFTSMVEKIQVGESGIARIDGCTFMSKDISVKQFVKCIKNFMAEQKDAHG